MTASVNRSRMRLSIASYVSPPHLVSASDCLGHPVQDVLDGTQADRDPEHRGAKALHHTPAIAVGPGQFAHQGTEAGSIATDLLGRDVRMTPATTRLAPALM